MPVALRTEWLSNPSGIEAGQPRLSWELASDAPNQVQKGWQVIVAATEDALWAAQHAAECATNSDAILWDSGFQAGAQSFGIAYGGRTLRSSECVVWAVRVWDANDQPSDWSAAASWSMGLLQPADWKAQWISRKDESALHTDSETLELPPAAYFRKRFSASSIGTQRSVGNASAGNHAPSRIARAVLYFSALGLCEAWLNGKRVGSDWLEPGWSDYRRRAYYRPHDVTHLIDSPDNTLGVIVADGWYSGYLGFCLFVGYGPHRSGRNLYGKTPALLAQLEIHYTDGSVQYINSDESWQVSTDGPIREADILMGEAYDARLHDPCWVSNSIAADRAYGAQPAAEYPHPASASTASVVEAAVSANSTSSAAWRWQSAILAEKNGSVPALFYDTAGERPVELGFTKPARMQAYPAQPIRATQELPAISLKSLGANSWVFDLAQNFGGVIRLRIRGSAGSRIRLRYAEQLHGDGSVMTENLRRARATDFYILRGDATGEEWTPRFTYHGFRYVELQVLEGEISPPSTETVTGIVLHNETPLTGKFECSDPVLTQFSRNALWTQRANFVEVPTDCPQRDERLGWTGDALAFIRTAGFYADIAAFLTKWLDDVEEAQLDSGAYPDYCPFPMTHGKAFSTAWTDAGIVCPWTLWKVYGDVRVIEKHWASMERFMDWRLINCAADGTGLNHGNNYGDWLNVNEPTAIAYLDTCYHALCCQLMAEMAQRLGQTDAAEKYRERLQSVKAAFRSAYILSDGSLSETSQTAHVLALWLGFIPDELCTKIAARLAEKIRDAGISMTTGFLGSRLLLPVLSDNGYHDLASQLFQQRKFPSWGYEVVNGATSVWERWDSYTKEYGFSGSDGTQNAAMNSFSHYTFGAVMEWAFRYLAGIDTVDEGFGQIVIRPRIPSPKHALEGIDPIRWVTASYHSVRGLIVSNWRLEAGCLTLQTTFPPNTQGKVVLSCPAATSAECLLVNGKPYSQNATVDHGAEGITITLDLPSGSWTLELPFDES